METIMKMDQVDQQETVIAVIQMAFESIANMKLTLLQELLIRIPLEKMEVQATDILFDKLMTVASQYNRKSAVHIILSAWNRIYPTIETMPIFINLFVNNNINTEVLKFCSTAMTEFSYVEVIMSLIDYDSGPRTIMACSKADSVYGPQHMAIYEQLLEISETKRNDAVYNFLIDRIKANAPFAETPKWIGNFITILPDESLELKGYVSQLNAANIDVLINLAVEKYGITSSDLLLELGNDSNIKSKLVEYHKNKAVQHINSVINSNEYTPLDAELDTKLDNYIDRLSKLEPTFEIWDTDTAVNMLTASMVNDGANLDDISNYKNEIKLIWNLSTISDKIKLMQPIIKGEINVNLQDDINLFRLLGPANPMLNTSPDSDTMSLGGERMFTSNVILDDEQYDEFLSGVEPPSWFQGNCDECLNRIRNKYESVRVPSPHGGYEPRAFCSWRCARDWLNSKGSRAIVTNTMINILEAQMNKNGIQKRR